MLPKIDLPTYELKLPSSGKVVTVRPFTVKEEKLLMIAVESGSETDIINTTRQVINNCIVSDPINLDALPFFDIDYLFIALRAKSVGEAVDVKFRCEIQKDGVLCGHVFPVKIDISDVTVYKDPAATQEIRITNTLMFKMKYPNYALMKGILDKDSVINKKVAIIVGSIDCIVEKDKVYKTNDVPREELVKYVENLTQEQFKKLEYYIEHFPSFAVETSAKCPKCGYEHKLRYTDFTSFFV